jgi:hypothetical protein
MLRAPIFAYLPRDRRDTAASLRRSSAHRACSRASLASVLLPLLVGCGSRTGLDSGVLTFPLAANDAGAEPAATSIVLFGGLGDPPDGGDGVEGDTWIWTRATEWTQVFPPQSPSARFGAMAASLGGDVILFGGDGPVAETWRWNGVTWTQLQPSWSPPPLTSSVLAAMGPDLLLFGGYNEGAIDDDVWRWDGTTWSHDAPGVTPPPRDSPAGAVLDGKLVIFGGEDDMFEPIGDTWAYDGASWTQLQPAHTPSPRRGAVATAFNGTLVMFGGDVISASTEDWLSLDETWVWDGTDWTQEQPAQSPDPRSFAAMAAAGGEVVLFGGTSFGGAFLQPEGTWTWDGAAWTKEDGVSPPPRNEPAMAAR